MADTVISWILSILIALFFLILIGFFVADFVYGYFARKSKRGLLKRWADRYEG